MTQPPDPASPQPTSPEEADADQDVPTLAELRERARKLDEEVRRHLEALAGGR